MTFYPVPTRRSSKAWPTRHRYIWVRTINDVYCLYQFKRETSDFNKMFR